MNQTENFYDYDNINDFTDSESSSSNDDQV